MKSRTTEAGPYSDAEFNAAFVRTQRSDWAHVLIRSITLAVVFFVLARAIANHGLTSGYLLLPVAVEFVSLMWVGIILSLFVVDCPKFGSTNKPVLAIFWTLVIFGVMSARLAWNGDTDQLEFSRIEPGWTVVWKTVLDTGLVWALVAELLGLFAATVPEVIRWRKVGGSFVWTSTFGLGVRVAVMLLAGMAFFFLLMLLADSVGSWVFERPNRLTWLVYGFLLCVEVGALVLGYFWHQELEDQAAKAAS